MSSLMLTRGRSLLAALWGGVLLAVAFMAAPAAFEVLDKPHAGLFVARLFELEAETSMVLALLLMMIERRLQRDSDGPSITRGFMLPAGVLFSVVAGYYALQPLMEQAKAGQGGLSFLALHGISMGFYGLRIVLVLALALVSLKRAS